MRIPLRPALCALLIIPFASGCNRDRAPAVTSADSVPTIETQLVPPPDSAARRVSGASLDSIRAELARLSATLTAATRTADSLRALLGDTAIAGTIAAAAPAPPAAASADSTRSAADSALSRADSVALTGGAILEQAKQSVRSYGLRIFWAIVVFAIAMLIVRVFVYALDTLAERSAERRLFFKRLVPIARILIWAATVFFVIKFVFDIDAQGLFAATAALGVAIGFAAQDLLKNIFGGLVIIFDQPFQVGDKIAVGSNYGEVTSIGLWSTRIVTPDDSMVTVPNAQVVAAQVSNANTGALDCQVVTDLYLPGWADEAKAKQIAYQAAASSKFVYLQKPIVVLVKDEFRETFITHLKVKAYVLDARYEFAFMSDVTERARAEFRRQGVVAPMHGARAYVDLTPMGEARPNGDARTEPARGPAPT
jgi:small-conductance mechanosensitive channel